MWSRPVYSCMVIYIYMYIYIYIYSIRFEKPGGSDDDLPAFLQDGFHDVWFRFIMNVSLRLSLYLDFWSHFILFRMHWGFIWSQFGFH